MFNTPLVNAPCADSSTKIDINRVIPPLISIGISISVYGF